MKTEDEIGRAGALLSAAIEHLHLPDHLRASAEAAGDALAWVLGLDDGSFARNIASLEQALKQRGIELTRKVH